MNIDNIIIFLRNIIQTIERKKNELTISDLIAYSTTRPFNMKWQEFEELICYPIKQTIKQVKDIDNVSIEIPQNKGTSDITLDINWQKFDFNIKNYDVSRFQITTLSKQLSTFIDLFKDKDKTQSYILGQDLMIYIIDKIITELNTSITLFSLTKLYKNDSLDIYLGSFNKSFFSKIKYIKAIYVDRQKTPHWRLWFYLDNTDLPILSLDLWTNALNRWLWWENWNVYIDNYYSEMFHPFIINKNKDISKFNKIDNNKKIKHILNFIETELYNS